MIEPAVKEQILNDLDRLPREQQLKAAEFVHSLVSSLPKGTAGHNLLRFSGVIDDTSAKEMMEAIEEGCGQVDLDEW